MNFIRDLVYVTAEFYYICTYTVLYCRECPLTLCAERGYFDLIALLLER